MGGSYTHEFQVLNEAGEDTVATCSCGKVACNIEVADRRIPQDRAHRITWDRLCDQIEGLVDLKPYKQAQQITAWWNECPRRDTEGETQIDFHHVVLKCTTREKKKESVHYEDFFVFKSTGRALNEDRLDRLLGADVQLLSPASAKEQKLPITSARFYFDWSIHDVVQVDESHVAPEEQSSTDSSEVSSLPSHSYWGDLTEIVPGDCCNESSCPQQNQGVFSFQKGIEVGQTFYLGQKYSQAMKATIQDYANKPVPLEMGCYGLGVSRILQAVVEQYHTERGIRWPLTLAPFQCVVIPLNLEHQKDAIDFILAVQE